MEARELWLLRHAKSAWDADAATDFERPLAKRGRRDAPRMGAWMADEGLVPDLVVASPARRAQETVELLLEGMGEPGGVEVRTEERIYDARVSDLLDVVHSLPRRARRVLLVGHNPGLEEVLLWLAEERDLPRTPTGKLLPTCTLARLRFEGGWSGVEPSRGRMLGLCRARDLEG